MLHESLPVQKRESYPSIEPMEKIQYSSLCQLFQTQVKEHPKKPALFYKEESSWKSYSWSDWAIEIDKLANALRNLGFKKGDRIALISENRPEWVFVDQGILHMGGLNVAIYPSSIPSQIAYILNDCQARAIFVSNQEHLKKILQIQKNVPSLETVIFFDGPFSNSDKDSDFKIHSYTDFLKSSNQFKGKSLKEIWSNLTLDDLATLIYTSGTTGDPKGVMLTHGNLVSNALACRDHMPENQTNEEDPLNFSFLPLCHALERMAGYYYPISLAMPIAFAEAMDKIVVNLAEINPTRFVAVPRVLEKIYSKVHDRIEKSGNVRKALFYWALKVGKEYRQFYHKEKIIPFSLKLKYQFADRLVFQKLKKLMGGRIRLMIVGGAPLSPEISEFFDIFGIYVLQGYGLTETSPVCTVNLPKSYRFDTVGVALKGVKIRIASDGEIMIKGPHVMKGYYKLPDKTKEVFTEDGWFLTGDIGVLDEDGHLRITDRKKDMIVTAGGKNISPQNIENMLKMEPFVEQVCVIGDRRKYLSALIVPDFENLEVFAQKNGISIASREELVKNKEIRDLFQKSVGKVNKELSSFENIRKFTLLPMEFSESQGEITPTMKVKRKVIQEKFSAIIEKMY